MFEQKRTGVVGIRNLKNNRCQLLSVFTVDIEVNKKTNIHVTVVNKIETVIH